MKNHNRRIFRYNDDEDLLFFNCYRRLGKIFIAQLFQSTEMCYLSNNIYDYYNVSQGKITVPNMDDGEECALMDVSHFMKQSLHVKLPLFVFWPFFVKLKTLSQIFFWYPQRNSLDVRWLQLRSIRMIFI